VTDYTFLDSEDVSPKKPDETGPCRDHDAATSEPEVELSETTELLIKAGQSLDVLSMKTGVCHPLLQQVAQEHADWQAQHDQMGHHAWGGRSHKLFVALPEFTGFREVAAYSGYRAPQVAKNLFESWRKSPDHWVWVNGPCAIWGYAMAQSKKTGLWYACAIFADRKSR
jgi:hypothetical protein